MFYRKKPVVIQAWDVVELLRAQRSQLPEIIRDAVDKGKLILGISIISIRVSDIHDLIAGEKDMLLRGTAGEFYPCKKSVFAEIYDEAEEPVA